MINSVKTHVSAGEVADTAHVTTMEPIEPGCPRDSSCTVQDLLTFPDDGKRYELCDGNLLVSPASTPHHQRFISNAAQAQPPHLTTLPTVNLRVEPDEGPALYVYELDGDAYGPPAVHKAGPSPS
ncbi:hypothetical protein ACWEPN_24820 [Nonomuraea wenchangensis]